MGPLKFLLSLLLYEFYLHLLPYQAWATTSIFSNASKIGLGMPGKVLALILYSLIIASVSLMDITARDFYIV